MCIDGFSMKETETADSYESELGLAETRQTTRRRLKRCWRKEGGGRPALLNAMSLNNIHKASCASEMTAGAASGRARMLPCTGRFKTYDSAFLSMVGVFQHEKLGKMKP